MGFEDIILNVIIYGVIALAFIAVGINYLKQIKDKLRKDKK